jgi:hypothetical protein
MLSIPLNWTSPQAAGAILTESHFDRMSEFVWTEWIRKGEETRPRSQHVCSISDHFASGVVSTGNDLIAMLGDAKTAGLLPNPRTGRYDYEFVLGSTTTSYSTTRENGEFLGSSPGDPSSE